MEWTGLDIVEKIDGKQGGSPVLADTRITASAIVENYEGSLEDGLDHEAAIAETVENYPYAGEQRIRELLAHHYAAQAQHQP